MKFIVTDREGIEKGVLVDSSYVVISIHDPNTRPPHVRKQAGLRDTLVLTFDDAEELPSTALPDEIVLMSEQQAEQVREFVARYRGKVGTVVVHCEAGMSRSPAIAAALCRVFERTDELYWREYHPNRHVYRMILQAFNCSDRNSEP